MLTEKSFEAYEESGLEGMMGIMVPGMVTIRFPDKRTYMPADRCESDEEFLDRIERSKKAGRNLFTEEWELFVMDPDVYY